MPLPMERRHPLVPAAMSTSIATTFATLRSNGRMAFMPFLTAGDPDTAGTTQLLDAVASQGVDLIELGFPYSDPIADGPVIQASYTRALQHQLTVPQIFEAVKAWNSAGSRPPLLAMVSYALMYRRGTEWFLDQAKAAGFAGFIVPDLPGDEAAELFQLVRARGLDLVQLVAPTTPRHRVQEILKSCSGFVYCIAVAGTTGERAKVRDELLDQLKWLREETDLPLAVGFGISQPEHVDPLRGLADGVIVGSGLVRHLEPLAAGHATLPEVLSEISGHAAQMVSACHGG
ncbi:MAG: tryptophan synthase subunit alpha [Planctomycetaceae bacterium]